MNARHTIPLHPLALLSACAQSPNSTPVHDAPPHTAIETPTTPGPEPTDAPDLPDQDSAEPQSSTTDNPLPPSPTGKSEPTTEHTIETNPELPDPNRLGPRVTPPLNTDRSAAPNSANEPSPATPIVGRPSWFFPEIRRTPTSTLAALEALGTSESLALDNALTRAQTRLQRACNATESVTITVTQSRVEPLPHHSRTGQTHVAYIIASTDCSPAPQ